MSLFIPISIIANNGRPTWSDASCPLHNNGTHYVGTVKFNECGTTTQFTRDTVVFRNNFRDAAGGNIGGSAPNASVVNWGSQGSSVVEVSCEFHRESNLDFSYIPIQPHVVLYETNYGQLDLELTQYSTSLFKTPIPTNNYPVNVQLNNEVYIKLSIGLANNSDVALATDRCIATSSQSPMDPTSYPLIDCGAPTSSAVKLYPSPLTEKRFSFRAFQFNNAPGSTVFLHCQVTVCGATDHACVSSCNRRAKREADNKNPSHLVSTGPFVLDAKGSAPVAAIFAAVCLAVAVVATVVAIVGWRRHSHHDKTYSKLTASES
ncbi:hypothetical protein ScPMuIL_001813 [Solemya velum]